jgi:hypothetical protein
LADVDAQLRADGSALLVTSLTIEPRGAAKISFTLPPGWQLVQTLQNGVLAQSVPSGMRSWDLAAPSAKLPYRVTIVTTSGRPARLAGGPVELAAPAVERMPTRHAAWSISGSAPASRGSGVGLTACSADAIELLRLETAASVLQGTASALAADFPDEELGGSFIAAWQEYQSALAQLGGTSPSAAGELAARRKAAEQHAEAARQRALSSRALDAKDLAVVPDTPATPDSGRLCFTAAGAGSELVLLPPRRTAGWTSDYTAALLAAAGLALLLAPTWRRFLNWIAEHASLAVAAVGIAWWLLAPCGLAGWLLVLAAAWIAVRWPWRWRSYDPASATDRIALASTGR